MGLHSAIGIMIGVIIRVFVGLCLGLQRLIWELCSQYTRVGRLQGITLGNKVENIEYGVSMDREVFDWLRGLDLMGGVLSKGDLPVVVFFAQ